MEDIIDSLEAARLIGITPATLHYHVRMGRLQADALIGKSLVFKRETIERFIRDREEGKIRALKEGGRI
jgi:predicted site-specific integrase-resolvase